MTSLRWAAKLSNLDDGWRKEYVYGLLKGIVLETRTVDFVLSAILEVIEEAEEQANKGTKPSSKREAIERFFNGNS